MGEVKKLNPTINFQASDLERVPVLSDLNNEDFISLVKKAIDISREDWGLFENNHGFTFSPLLTGGKRYIREAFEDYKVGCENRTQQLQVIEEEINRKVVSGYGLEGYLEPAVDIRNITLRGNAQYRFSSLASSDNDLFKTESMYEFISYAVACIFGRLSVDKSGIILAGSGGTLSDFLNMYLIHLLNLIRIT